MSDPIDRETAIDALVRFSLGETDAIKLAFRMNDYLKRLPSAIIHCKDCRYYNETMLPMSGELYKWCSRWTDYEATEVREDEYCSRAEGKE